GGDEGLRLDPEPDPAWLGRYRRFGSHSELRASELRASLRLLTLPHTVASLGDDAVGVAAVWDRWVTIHSIAVSPPRRRRRLGTRITRGLVSWGASMGADRAFLHVDGTNHAAVALHTSLGFEIHHPYWYRVRRVTPRATDEAAPDPVFQHHTEEADACEEDENVNQEEFLRTDVEEQSVQFLTDHLFVHAAFACHSFGQPLTAAHDGEHARDEDQGKCDPES
ncbi:MAG: GNAT family N-acetyltransferase, partial [Halobacteriales archaeon]|nr:GNAT family N-acetyltransferase [Halobacteriales archaeon]